MQVGGAWEVVYRRRCFVDLFALNKATLPRKAPSPLASSLSRSTPKFAQRHFSVMRSSLRLQCCHSC